MKTLWQYADSETAKVKGSPMAQVHGHTQAINIAQRLIEAQRDLIEALEYDPATAPPDRNPDGIDEAYFATQRVTDARHALSAIGREMEAP